ncbi:MAG: hypothetical protein ACFE0S_03830 [Rhodospirillales bacterium]
MSEVAPPSPTPPPAGQALPPRLAVALTQAQLADLPLGAKLDVIVSSISDAAELKVTSRLGEIAVKLPPNAGTAFKPGDALLLQILTKGANPKAQLALPDGRPLTFTAGGTAQPASAQTATSAATGQQAASPAVQVTPGALVTATLLRPVGVDGAGVLQAQTQPATGGTGTAQTSPSGPGLSGPQAGVQAGSPAAGAPSAQTGIPAPQTGTPAPAQGVTTFPAGSGLKVRIVTVNVPASPPQSLVPPPVQGQISLAPGAQLTGVVSGNHGVGQTLVQTHAGPVTLPTQQPLPPGTEIRFEIVSLQTPASVQGQHGPQHMSAAPVLEGNWFAFEDALSTLRDTAPGAHQHILQAALPRADAQLATNVLFFLSALRGGDIKNWLGDGPMRILDRVRPDLAGRLRTDLTQMTRTVEDPASGDWRLHGVPFLHGEELDRIQLLIRDRDAEDGEEEDGRGGTRFVVDLNLSQLGHLQIDGLVGENDKRLDLVLRTDDPLKPNMCEDIRRLFHDALDLTGLDGSVGFKANPGNFVDIPRRQPGAAGDVMA